MNRVVRMSVSLQYIISDIYLYRLMYTVCILFLLYLCMKDFSNMS